MGVDLCDYSQNVEWDVVNVTAKRRVKVYPCCPDNSYPDITFFITMRRKTLFYTVNLIMPIVAISTLTALVFYLPSESGEKITLSISILLALTVFFLILSDINPPTSLVIPLLGKYLLFTMIVVTMSIFLTVYTLSIHFRSPATHKMTPWTKKVFIEILPQVLCMRRPDQKNEKLDVLLEEALQEGSENDKNMARFLMRQREKQANNPNIRQRTSVYSLYRYPDKIKATLKGVTFIAEHLKNSDKDRKVGKHNFIT